MEKLLEWLQIMMPEIRFEPGPAFRWSPQSSLVTYRNSTTYNELDEWALLHEAGHAALQHQGYNSDLQLLLLEVAAWEKAVDMAQEFNTTIDEDHIQDCLDTYRDWLHQRSACPACSATSLQISPTAYRCHNCTAEWQVTTSRFCRAYRRRKLTAKEKTIAAKARQATFI